MEMKIGENIRTLRQQKNINQEALAAAFSVSIQAVSKWETGASLPDVALIPSIAEFFGVTIDQLFYGLDSKAADAVGTEPPAEAPSWQGREKGLPFPNDNKVRVVQYIGHRLVKAADKDLWDGILLNLEETMENISMSKSRSLQIEVWGHAQLEGDLTGDIHAGGSVECGEVEGDVHAGGSVNCGEISGDARVGGSLSCGEIGGDVTVGGDAQIEGEVSGDLKAGGSIACGDVSGNVNAHGGSVECRNVDGDVKAQNVTCGEVGGDVQAKTVTHIHP
ncbi:MAG: helix-turn-helix domain-containing protein [Oscillospiraceae bacterium]|nr:helix-turn-helix domain-containing protein [Oscillospiraceae bacterium]